MAEIIAGIILLTLITGTFKALQLGNEDIINAIENASQAPTIFRVSLVIGGLLFVRWQMFWLPDAVIATLLVIIVYEAVIAAAMLFFRDGYLNFLKDITLKFPAAFKIPVAAELLFFCFTAFLVVKNMFFL